MSETTSPSRRTLMKGAAWAVPAVAVASAAPALAASPIISCQPADTLGFGTQNADVISWTRVVGTDKALAGGLGSAFDMRLGTWQTAKTAFVDNTGKTVHATGYKMNFASEGVVLRTVKKVENGGAKFFTPAQWTMGRKDAAGNDTWSGRLTVRPNDGPLVIGAGLVYTGTLQTNMQYQVFPSALQREVYGTLMVSFPLTLTLLRGLGTVAEPWTPLSPDCPGYYMNFIMNSNILTTYSISGTTNAKQAWAGLNPRDAWLSQGLPELPPYAG